MKKLLLIFLVLSISLLTRSQGAWSPRTSLPDSVRAYGIGFSIGNYGYAGLGFDIKPFPHQNFNDFWQFDPSTDSWARKADFPGNARVSPATFVIGIYAYVVTGGETSYANNFTTECWQYNSATNVWSQKNNFPGLSRAYAVGFSIGNRGYIGTGYDTLGGNTPVLRDIWEYNSATDTWTQKNNFAGIARYQACAFSVEGNAYICFGYDSSTNGLVSANDTWQYDTAADSWTRKSNNPLDSLVGANGFVINNNIYVGDGFNYSHLYQNNGFWKYNPATDVWTQQADLPTVHITGCSAFAVGDTGYMGFGWDTGGPSPSSNEMYRFIPDSVTGIYQVKDNTEIAPYPNPFQTSCTICLPKYIGDLSQVISLYDMQGRKVNVTIEYSCPYYIIERGTIADGIYLLAIYHNGETFYRKLIITD